MSKQVFYIDGRRTPFGSLNGVLSSVAAPQLAAPLMASLIKDLSLTDSSVDQVILGQVIQAGCGQAPARQATLLAGLAPQVQSMTINKVCGSGLKALMLGAGSILLDESALVFAGGMESMSRAPHALLDQRKGLKVGDMNLVDLLFHDALTDPYSKKSMGLLVEQQIAGGSVTREVQDEYAVQSYQRAIRAQERGRFVREILPVLLQSRTGDLSVVEDEEPKRVQFDKITQLKPAFSQNGCLTAANSSSINDGAALCLLGSAEEVRVRGLSPKAELVSWASVSLAPEQFSVAPLPAIFKVLDQAKLKVSDIDLYEINEAFSAVPLMAIQGLKLDPERVNVNGGAVALGHPVGASGARLAITLVEELIERQGKYGVAALCIGGGEAVAMLFRRVEDHEF